MIATLSSSALVMRGSTLDRPRAHKHVCTPPWCEHGLPSVAKVSARLLACAANPQWSKRVLRATLAKPNMLSRERAKLLPFLLLWAACSGSAAHKANGDLDASTDAQGVSDPCAIGSAGSPCTPCPAGSFCPGGTTPMALCPTNTFDDDRDPKTPCVAASSCPAGSYVAAPYSRVTDQRCAECPSGSFSTGINTRSCTDFRKCTVYEFIAEPGSALEDHVCKATRICATEEYESVAPTLQSDRQCIAYTLCTSGQYVSSRPTASSDRACTDCATGFFSVDGNAGECLPWRECGANEVESRAPSSTHDRECACQTSSDEDAGTCPEV
jgi:hypothetical protein